ncbi:cell envelope integrity protein TolA [sulfur-oxidizing endosymbiont of Gigantopelta aegis]|uniref:cell envelope integrity protein TolA n=1 Tax=sulfur-oxidizing endosymbiont of Gigantopelta aegis TaxID=2794934 RepID=UPI0018DD3002|nr:cell envelope integrity protein TolA [sulfur-oxidizing endosymbiont of Gigantopelta aegis]
MFDWIKENSIAFVVAVVLHIVFLGALFFNWHMDQPETIVLKQGDIIQVTSVDANSYDAEIKKIADTKKAERRKKQQQIEKKRKLDEQRKKAKALEKKKKQEKVRRKKEAKKKAEREKKALVKKKTEQEKKRKAAKKKAADEKRKKEAAKRKEELKKAEQEKQRLAEKKKQQAAERKRKAEQDKKRQAELKHKEAREREEWERRSKGIINRHVSMIAQKIERNWRQPLNAPGGLECRVDIVLLPSGNVNSVKMAESSGNLEFDSSCETAVRRASPLPVPTDSVIFKKFEVMRLRFEPGR